MHKKGVTEEVAKKRTRRTIKSQRGVVGASVDLINTRTGAAPDDVTPSALLLLTQGMLYVRVNLPVRERAQLDLHLIFVSATSLLQGPSYSVCRRTTTP